MGKSLHFNQATYINQLFKKEGIPCVLHLRAGCLSCMPVLECEEAYLDKAYALMNAFLKDQFIKVRPNEIDPTVVEVY